MSTSIDHDLSQKIGNVFGLGTGATEASLARADRRQISAALLRSLQSQSLLAPSDIYRIVPRRTWLRRKADAELSRHEFDGLYRLVRIQALAELVFGDTDRARAWLHSPKERLGGETPMAFSTDTLGFDAVQSWLYEIDQGWFA